MSVCCPSRADAACTRAVCPFFLRGSGRKVGGCGKRLPGLRCGSHLRILFRERLERVRAERQTQRRLHSIRARLIKSPCRADIPYHFVSNPSRTNGMRYRRATRRLPIEKILDLGRLSNPPLIATCCDEGKPSASNFHPTAPSGAAHGMRPDRSLPS